VDRDADIPVVFLMIKKIKLIFRAIAREVGLFMTPSEKRRKEKFFEEMHAHSEETQDKAEPMPCPMHEDYDEADYRQADHLDEIADVNKRR
jgi:hypothetical protein